MLRIANPDQGRLIDPFDYLGPKRRQMLETGWPYLFREFLYRDLPIEEIKNAFHADMGRPTKELHTALGILVLQQLFDLTDEQTVHQLAFNIEWHYALNLVNEEDESKYISERTVRSYRALVIELGVDVVLFGALTDGMLQRFAVPTGRQRMDSTHIRSDMRKLSRLELLARTVEKFLRTLARKHPQILQKEVDAALQARYLKEEENGCFSRVKPSEAERTLQQVAEDLWVLVQTFRRHPQVGSLHEFRLLERVWSEQCEVREEGGEAKVVVKEAKQVPSTSLQNPSDPDATYDGHKGQGYQVQLMETYQVEEAESEPGEDESKPKPNFITYVKVQPAHESDSDEVMPAIEETQERDCAPDTLLADTAYGSDDNVQRAAAEGVDFIAPTPGKPAKKEECLILDDFTIDPESGEVTQCPAGEPPEAVFQSENGKWHIYFDGDACAGCEHRDYCIVGQHEKNQLQYDPKERRLAQRRVEEESETFREKYRYRSGIEATNSHLKRDLKMGRLRVRGLAKVRYVVNLKALGWNIKQAVRAMKARLLPLFEWFPRWGGWDGEIHFLNFHRFGGSGTPTAHRTVFDPILAA